MKSPCYSCDSTQDRWECAEDCVKLKEYREKTDSEEIICGLNRVQSKAGKMLLLNLLARTKID